MPTTATAAAGAEGGRRAEAPTAGTQEDLVQLDAFMRKLDAAQAQQRRTNDVGNVAVLLQTE